MIAPSLPRLAVLVLLGVALPPVCLAGAHLHLCFDGLERPVTVHPVADGGDHVGHHGSDEEHSDSDLDLEISVTRAGDKSTAAPAAVLVVARPSTSAPPARLSRAARPPLAVRSAPWSVLPPLRAPPA